MKCLSLTKSAMSCGWNKSSPKSLFSWDFGTSRSSQPEPKYYDEITLPFPPSLVSKTFLKGRELKCCYKATVDGFSAKDFHAKCDFKGPCVIIGYTNESLKFGVFSPEGYRSTDNYFNTFDAFLFYWPKTKPVVVLPKVGGSGAALFDYARGGPQFGAGLLIGPPLAPVMGGFAGPDTNSGVGDLRQAKSSWGCLTLRGRMGRSLCSGMSLRRLSAKCCFFLVLKLQACIRVWRKI